MTTATLRALTGAAALTVIAGAPAAAQRFAPNAKVDGIFAQWDKPDSPGCAVGVLQKAGFIYQRGYGMANLDYDIPNSPELVERRFS